ncbi:hypothetical protein R6Q59_017231 [Mikania micrantha]|uniref:Uncharacterized protein n=1 Tax=Mikania micrantha TaxID=192012 RepID=A0A5N6M4A0_9ASTR|nr:hypothetical protein E3N88_36625 [Mikania micrantha]
MRCKKHSTDLSSIVGVCASCLRERLFHLIAAQEQARAQTLEEQNRNSEAYPVFPRSVSPYITRRKSDNSASSAKNQRNSDRNRQYSLPDQRFFSTPQLAPATEGYNSFRKKKHGFIRFSLLSKLFRSKKQTEQELDSDPRGSCGAGDSTTSATSSPFWFSNLRSGGDSRKKQPIWFTESSTASGTGVTRKQYCPDRGMSPVRYSDCGGVEDEFCDGSSGYETCESRKQTPWRTPAHPSNRRGGGSGGGNGKNVSGLAFCLSPLVRASPCRQWNPPADGGDVRAQVKPHLLNTKSFCANRSRKLADFGRFNTNR